MQTRIELTFDVVSAASSPLEPSERRVSSRTGHEARRLDTADLKLACGDDRDATLDVGRNPR
jgi:hypothetical protein